MLTDLGQKLHLPGVSQGEVLEEHPGGSGRLSPGGSKGEVTERQAMMNTYHPAASWPSGLLPAHVLGACLSLDREASTL